MKNRNGRKLTAVCMAALLLAGCSSEQIVSDSSTVSESEDVKVYAIVAKAEGNPYNELMAEGFAQIIEEAGDNCVISYPEEATAEDQIEVIDDLISQGVDSITVAANDADALSDVLNEAREQGIHITAVDSDVKVTGLGLPSDMAEYVTGEDPVCPYLYLWNPIELGQIAAYVAIALTEEEIEGEAGETFAAGEMGNFQVEENDSGGAEVILNSVICFDKTNIDEWKDLF